MCLFSLAVPHLSCPEPGEVSPTHPVLRPGRHRGQAGLEAEAGHLVARVLPGRNTSSTLLAAWPPPT